jgi:hypothetical protein
VSVKELGQSRGRPLPSGFVAPVNVQFRSRVPPGGAILNGRADEDVRPYGIWASL